MNEMVQPSVTRGRTGIAGGHGVTVTRQVHGTVDYMVAWPLTSEMGRATGEWSCVSGRFDTVNVWPDAEVAGMATIASAAPKLRADEGAATTLSGLSDVAYELYGYMLPDNSPENHRQLFDEIRAALTEEVARLRRETAKPGETVAQWYAATFPGDELGGCIDPDLDFEGAAAAVRLGGGFYEALGVGDSVIRERVFDEIAARRGVDYGQVYDSWSELKPLPPCTMTIRGVLVACGEAPCEVEIEVDGRGSALRGLQALVGGQIEPFGALSDDLKGADIFVNDSGLFECPPNRAVYATRAMAEAGYLSQLDYASVVKPGDLYTVLHGDIVAVGFDEGTGASTSLTEEQASAVGRYFSQVSPAGSGELEEALLRQGMRRERRETQADELTEALEAPGGPEGGDDMERGAIDGRDDK